MVLRPFLNDASFCASYLFGCTTHGKLAVVDPHVDLAEGYLVAAAAIGAPIVAVFETHVQADHVSGLPALVERAGATAYLPEGSDVEFEHHPLADGDVVELGNTLVTAAIATLGHAPAHHAYAVADRRRGGDAWLLFSGDALLVDDVGWPDLHVAGGARAHALLAYASVARLPFADGSFDAAISNGVIDLIPDKDAVFAELSRVLRPCGRLQIADVTIQRPVSEEGRRNIDLWTG